MKKKIKVLSAVVVTGSLRVNYLKLWDSSEIFNAVLFPCLIMYISVFNVHTNHNRKQEGQDGSVSFTWLPDKSESIAILVQEKKFNIYFQDGSHLGFPIRTILATFDLQVTSILPMKFESITLLVQEKKFKIDFQNGC